jgi:hypothetical protein
MAKTCGIHLAGRRFQLVALDGSFKKPRVRACIGGSAPADSEDLLGELSAGLRARAKQERKQLSSENIGLCVESSLATFRTLSLPFADPAKIEEVLKFEVESQLPQWDIDAVVVDFHVIRATPVESHLLVTAVPKSELSTRIQAADKAGFEPLDVEVEGTALFRAAEQAGLLDPAAAQCLVHFGLRTTTLVTVVAGELRSMRALHLELGDFDVADEGDAVGEKSAAGDGEGEGAAVAPPPPADPARLEQVRSRVLREVSRTLSSARAEVEFSQVYVCGAELGLVGGQVLGTPIERLDPLEGLVELDPQQRARFVIAFGAALGRLGGSVVKPHLRREQLAYASKFERLELPLGVLALLVLTLLASKYIMTNEVLNQRIADIRRWQTASQYYMIGKPGTDIIGALRPTAQELQDDPLYSYVLKVGAETGPGDTARSFGQQIANVETLIERKITDMHEALGAARDLTLPQSAMTGLNLVLDLLRELADEGSVGRFSIRSASAEYVPARGSSSDRVQVDLNLTFFGANDLEGSNSFSAFVRAIEAQPWLADSFDRPATNVLENGKGIYVDRLRVVVDTTKAQVEG